MDSACTFFLTSSILSQKKLFWFLSIFLICELLKSISLVSICHLQISWFMKLCMIWGFCHGVMRSSLFWDVRRHWLVVSSDVPGWTVCPKTSVTNNQHCVTLQKSKDLTKLCSFTVWFTDGSRITSRNICLLYKRMPVMTLICSRRVYRYAYGCSWVNVVKESTLFSENLKIFWNSLWGQSFWLFNKVVSIVTTKALND